MTEITSCRNIVSIEHVATVVFVASASFAGLVKNI